MREYGIDLDQVQSVADFFTGTGIVAMALCNLPRVTQVWVNDVQPYALSIAEGRLTTDSSDAVQSRLDLYHVDALKRVAEPGYQGGWITEHHSAIRDGLQMFSRGHALELDALASVIPVSDKEARASLMESILRCSNTYGHLKSSARARADFPLPRMVPLSPSGRRPDVLMHTTNQCAEDIHMESTYDIVYLDPPYRSVSYGVFYHLLNTIALRDSPVTTGINSVRRDAISTNMEKKRTFKHAFSRLLRNLNTRYICVSYANYGIATLDDLKEMIELAGFASVRVFEQSMLRYRGNASAGIELVLIALRATDHLEPCRRVQTSL
jgi:adenine-specific DNA methylase